MEARRQERGEAEQVAEQVGGSPAVSRFLIPAIEANDHGCPRPVKEHIGRLLLAVGAIEIGHDHLLEWQIVNVPLVVIAVLRPLAFLRLSRL